MENKVIGDWLSDIAARTPAPGGGAAAALAAATSAALIGMVTNYTTGKKWADRAEQMAKLNDEADSLCKQSLQLAEDDAEAFVKVGVAYKLSSETTVEKIAKAKAIQAALAGAAVPPAKVAELARRLAAMCYELLDTSNPNVISDVAVAASMARGALESAIVNIEINEQMITDKKVKAALAETVQKANESIIVCDGVVTQVRSKIGQPA